MQLQRQLIKLCILSLGLVCFLDLSACGNAGKDKELQNYINEVKSRPSQTIEPLPKVEVPAKTTYSAGSLRSPFQPSVALAPEIRRKREVLEAFPLDTLRFVGTFKEGQRIFALIAAPNNVIHKVTIGAHLGQNYGRIVQITKNNLEVVETLTEDGKWRQQNVFLKLWTPIQSQSSNPTRASAR